MQDREPIIELCLDGSHKKNAGKVVKNAQARNAI